LVLACSVVRRPRKETQIRTRARFAVVLVAALAAMLCLTSTASAALPRRGATYIGEVAGKTIKVKISKRTRLKAKYTYDCGDSGGPVKAYTKLKGSRDGRFFGADEAGLGPNISSLRVRFTSTRRARARFRVSICDRKGGRLRLKRV
jgi:hypothetical protein